MYYVNTSISFPSFYSCYIFLLLTKPSSGCKIFLLEEVMYGSAMKLFKVRIPNHHIWYLYISQKGPGSSVCITTRYGLDGPGIETRWGRDFPYPYTPALRTTQPPIQWVPGISRG